MTNYHKKAHRIQMNQRAQSEWMDLRTLAQYASVSVRTLRDWIHADENPLPAVRVRGKILIHRREFDEWLRLHRV